jgi:hypothetical protein
MPGTASIKKIGANKGVRTQGCRFIDHCRYDVPDPDFN